MKVLEVPQNARVFLGVPAKPLPEPLVSSMSNALYSLEGIEDLHLPQCFALGVMEAPAQVLVIVVGANQSLSRITKRSIKALGRLIAPEHGLDIWPVSYDSAFASAVRQVNCLVERDPFCLPVFRKPPLWRRLLRTS